MVRNSLWLFIFFCGLRSIESYLVYKTTGLDCYPNHEFITNETCRVKAINRYKAVANMDCFSHYEMKNFSVVYQSYTRNSANLYKPFVVTIEFNVCDIFSDKSLPILAKIIMKIITPLSNINHSCPYIGWLRARNLFLDARLLPFAFPVGFYKHELRIVEYPEKYLGTINLYTQSIEVSNNRRESKKKSARL